MSDAQRDKGAQGVSEVSCAWTAVVLDRLGSEAKSLPLGGLEPSVLCNPLAWIRWSEFTQLLDALGGTMAGPRDWFDFGRVCGTHRWPLSLFGRLAVSPERLTRWGFRFLGTRLVPVARIHRLPDDGGCQHFEIHLPSGGRAGEVFFWMTAGQAAMLPGALGLAESMVEVAIEEGGAVARFAVRPPPSLTLAAIGGRLAQAAFALRGSAMSLDARQFELTRSRAELFSLARDFRLLIDALPYGIGILAATGRVLYANAEFARIVGHEGEKIDDSLFLNELLEFDPAGRRAGDSGLFNRLDTPSRSCLRARLVSGTRSGSEVFLETSGSQPVMFEGQVARLVFCRDVTARRHLERRVINAGEDERRRVAVELHDGLGQLLAALSLQAQTLGIRAKAEGVSGRVSSAAEDLGATSQEALSLARSLARGLAPVAEFDGGLVHALRRLARRVENGSGPSIEVAFDVPRDFSGAGDETNLHCYRIAQEALHNAVRHANAQRIGLDLAYDRDARELTLTISDDGTGLPAANLAGTGGSGIGIHAMHFRAAAIGGALEIGRGEDGTGTIVTLKVPVPEPADEDPGAGNDASGPSGSAPATEA